MTKPYRTVRVVIECRVPQHITEKQLVWKLKRILKWPIQLGHEGDHTTLVRPLIKEYGKVRAYERRFEPRGFKAWARSLIG